MLNELYTFAEPVQVVPFSSLKWGKFTLLHTIRGIYLFLMDSANYNYGWGNNHQKIAEQKRPLSVL